MTLDYRIISIGTLESHPLWNESKAIRTGHATTTLITTDDAKILVDPSLPPTALLARLGERTPVRPDEITHVFMTSLDPLHRRAVTAFPDAKWFAAEAEREAALADLDDQREEARSSGDEELQQLVEQSQDVVSRCAVAPDHLTHGVDLFPLPGVTPGCCGLLLALARQTVLICGDAVPTVEHLAQGQVLPDSVDVEQAQESFREAVEIADVLVLGRDNVVANPLRPL